MPFEVRPTRDQDEFGRAIYGIGQYFGAPFTDEQLERFGRLVDDGRMHAAFEGDEIVGGAGAFTYQLSVPGGVLPCAGVTCVGVYPTHRRRGVLRALMAAQLEDCHARGEPLAALWASEETIYGRFGYGVASWAGELEVERAWNAFARPLERRGRVRFVTPEEALELFPPIWEELARQRSGVFARSTDWWRLRRLRLPDEEKGNPKRFAVLEIDGSARAYAIFRSQVSFDHGVSNARLEVLEVIGTTPQATAEIWRFVLDVDWMASVSVKLVPPDHPLFQLLATPRRAGYRMGDGLWVRVVDVGAAFSGRAYAGEGSVVVDVRDPLCPWNEGRWRIAPDGAAQTDEPAELVCDVDALGSAFFGAVSFAQLQSGLRVEELVEGAVARADALSTWRPLPWCPEIF